MNNVFVYCEIEDGHVVDVSLELLTKGRNLANQIGKKLEAIAIGSNLKGIEKQIFPYGVDVLHIADQKELDPYLTLPHFAIVKHVFEKEEPEIGLFGASSVGRDLAPRIASALKCGLTADCTSLEIGDHFDKKQNKEYKNILYQIRPAFGGNIIATIINPETRPQLATVREGVMRKEELDSPVKGKIKNWKVEDLVGKDDFVV